MTMTVKRIALGKQLESLNESIVAEPMVAENYLGLIGNVQVNCVVRLGSLTITVASLRKLKEGQILSLDQKTNEPVDILLNDQIIARGSLMSCDEEFAVQITEVFSCL